MIDKSNYEAMLVQYHDGTLDQQAMLEVEQFLSQHPEIAAEDSLYYDTRPIVAHPKAEYQHKNRLKRPTAAWRTAWRWAAAACLAGVIAGVWWIWSSPTPNESQVAQTTTPSIQNVITNPTTPQPVAVKPNETAQKHVPTATMSVLQQGMPQMASGEALPTNSPQPQHKVEECLSDKLVVYGCNTATTNQLVHYADDEKPCNTFACRLAEAGQHLGM